MNSVYVVVDNLSSSVVGIFFNEENAKGLISFLGNEKINDDVFRFAYEMWTWNEVVLWRENPKNMGLKPNKLPQKN